MIFGSHLPAYTSCLVAATGAAALVGAAGVSIAEYQGKKQTKSTHHIHSQCQGREQDVPPPTYLRVWMTAPPPASLLSEGLDPPLLTVVCRPCMLSCS